MTSLCRPVQWQPRDTECKKQLATGSHRDGDGTPTMHRMRSAAQLRLYQLAVSLATKPHMCLMTCC
jgi:hypothetical protein